MKARGRVSVGCPVDADGAATADWNAMVGIAGRVSYAIHTYEDGEEFPLETDRECLIDLIGPMSMFIVGIEYRLSPHDKNHVTIKGGKIVDFDTRDRRR